MTAKEVAIKLFKLKMPLSLHDIDLTGGHITHGCKFIESNEPCHIGISITSNILRFNNIIFELDNYEHTELYNIYDNRKRFLDFEKSEQIRIKQKIDFEILSEVASKENFNSSRRVLTENIQILKMKIKELTDRLDYRIIPKKFQESYDNCGLIVGSGEKILTGILTTLDVTEEVVLEAEDLGCNLIIAHHPIIFFAIKSMVESNSNQKTVMLAISKRISIYAAHTSLDNRFSGGINEMLAKKIGLKHINPLKKIKTVLPGWSDDVVMGSGAIGELLEPKSIIDFLFDVRKILEIKCPIKYSTIKKNVQISKIALCSGAGLFMAQEAKNLGAELFITSDITYHNFFDETNIILADIGHYDSEKHAPEVIYNIVKGWVPELIQVSISKINTNPVSSIC